MEQPINLNKPRPGRPSEQKILSMIDEYEQSGFSVEDYCQVNELNESTFRSWLARYRSKEESPGFVSVTIPADLHEGSVFAECRGIKFYQRVEASYLKEILS
jgi:Transposase